MNRSRRLAAMAYLGLVAAMPLAVNAACMDGHPSVTSELKDSTMVVVGTATEEHNIPDLDDPEGYISTIYVIKVSEVLKGPAPSSFWLYSENTTARYPMDLGKPHLLFVEQFPNLNYVSSCGNSGPMAESQKAYRAVKRTLAKPSNAKDVKDGSHATSRQPYGQRQADAAEAWPKSKSPLGRTDATQ